jgi:peptidoglycan/xylan/chitin deacetylase (PgdA/CDA1 family)
LPAERPPWGPDHRRAAVTVSFDNLGEVTELRRGTWPEDEPLGRHFSVTRSLPRILALLEEVSLRATFFVEGLNTELYPESLREIAAAGHEVAYHGWCHEQWAELGPSSEAELLERGVHAMEELGVRPEGFRPPGGRLASTSLAALERRGFTYCSPAGEGVGVEHGVVILPFRWRVLDAYHYLPRFADLRQRDHGSAEALPPGRFAETLAAELRGAVESGRHLSLVFHPFLAWPEERFKVVRGQLAAVRALVVEGVVWCAPYGDVAGWIRDAGEGAFEELDLDATAA